MGIFGPPINCLGGVAGTQARVEIELRELGLKAQTLAVSVIL